MTQTKFTQKDGRFPTDDKVLMPQPKLSVIIILGLLLRVAYAAAIYEPSLLSYNLDDYVSYRIAATDILAGDLSFSNDVYTKRPPVYSLLVAALGIQPLLVIAANLMIGLAIVPLTYMLARQVELPRELALLAALIVVLDPASIRSSVMLRADSLASFWLAIAFVTLMKSRDAESWRGAIGWGILSGTFIMLSALTRPAAYLLWIPLGAWLAFSRGGQLRPLAAFWLVATGLVFTGTWQQHNLKYFNNSSFSTAGTFQLLYVRAASVMYQATDLEINQVYEALAKEVEERLGNETENVTEIWRHGHLASSSEMQAIMTDLAIEVFLEYPIQYVLTIPVGLYRMLLEVRNWPVLAGVGWNLGLLFMASAGLWHLLRARRILDSLFLVLPCLYFATGTLLVATSSYDTRARVMITPLLAVMAAYGVMRILNRRKAASASLSLPADS